VTPRSPGRSNVENTIVISGVLKQSGFDRFFSRAALAKAVAYQAQGRVSIVESEPGSNYIHAYVRGTGAAPYEVEISLKLRDGRLAGVTGDCDCPMAFNCKHVAAVLFEMVAADGNVRAATRAAFKRAEQPALPGLQPLPPELNSWLQKIGGTVRDNDYPAEIAQRVLYCIRPHGRGARMQHLAVTPISIRLLRGGTFSDKVSRANVAGFNRDSAPAYFRESDIEIASALSHAERTYDEPDLYLVSGAELLQRIVATGRAYWLDHLGKPLNWGEPRKGRIEWRQISQAGLGAYVFVEAATALRAEPPVYVDPAANTVGLAETGLSPRLAYHLLSAPLIPRAHVEQVARRLAEKLPSVDHDILPVPPVPAVKIDEEPVPVLRLATLHRSETYSIYGRPKRFALATPSFRYGTAEIHPFEKDKQVEVFRDGQVYAVSRRLGKEREAMKRLTDIGFVKATSVDPYLEAEHRGALTLPGADHWFDFLNLRVRRLREEGFEIQVDDDFAYRLAAAADSVEAELQSSGIDWFELGLGIEIDGVKQDLTPIVAKLIADPDFDPDAIRALATAGKHLYLPLADGRYIALAANRFLPLILALHGLKLNGAFADAKAKISLSRAEIVPLIGLESEDFSFKGADNLRRLAQLLRSRDSAAIQLPAQFKATLRPYQAYGLAWLDLLRESGLGGVLADDMGLGKTVQVLALLALEKTRGNLAEPVLIVAPTSLMTNWFNEAQRFAPDLKFLVLHGPDRRQDFAAIPEYDVVLTTYPLIARDREVLLSREWHMAVLDEAQTVKNPDAATTRWLRDVRARHRFCLTGTPMENHLGELWSIMSFVNPGYLGDKAAFSRQWRIPIEKRADKARAAALAQRVKPFLLRRTKTEVATELPAKSEIIEAIVLEGAQRDLYDSIRLSMSRKVRKAIEERGLAKSHIVVLEALLRMRQACCDPALLKLDDGIERPSAKLDRLIEMVLELLSEGRKIIVFSQFTSMLDLIRRRFDAEELRYSVLTGETRDRKKPIEAFQNGASDVFLISLKAGGVGLNLTAADTVIIFDPWWNPAVEEQAIDRAHRIGQDKAVFVYRLVAAGTIEEKMDELKARKRALADSLFDRDGRIASTLTEDDVKALFDA
jgi:superfamily II DNA or RNA helicase